MSLPTLVQKDEIFSPSCPSAIAMILRDLDSDRRDKTEAELLWYYATSPNPWLPVEGHVHNDLVFCGRAAKAPTTVTWRDFIRRIPPTGPEALDHAMGRPYASCLPQVESFLRNTVMTGLASAWAMATRRPI